MLCSVGHKGKFGHEFMEFELRADGRLRYSNNSKYKNDVMIRKEGMSRQFSSIEIIWFFSLRQPVGGGGVRSHHQRQ